MAAKGAVMFGVMAVCGALISGFTNSAAVPPNVVADARIVSTTPASLIVPTQTTDNIDTERRRVVARKPAASTRSRNPWKPRVRERAWKYLVIHHTASDRGDVASIDAVHRRRKDQFGNPWEGIGYHFVIGNGQGMPDGKIEPTFRWTRQIHGAHAGVADYNELGVGICLVGNFEQGRPSQKQIRSLRALVADLKAAYGITRNNIVGHGQVRKTACPGRHLSIDEICRDHDHTIIGHIPSPAHHTAFAAESEESQ